MNYNVSLINADGNSYYDVVNFCHKISVNFKIGIILIFICSFIRLVLPFLVKKCSFNKNIISFFSFLLILGDGIIFFVSLALLLMSLSVI